MTDLKILFILPEYYPHSGGGICTYYLHYIRAIKPYCQEIKVIVGSGYDQRDEHYELDGIAVDYLSTNMYAKYLALFSKYDLLPEFKRNLAAAWAMYEQAGEGKGFDLVECTEFGLGFIPWVIRHDKPVVTRLHGSRGQIALNESERPDDITGDFTRQTELLLLPRCDQLITYSGANRDFWNGLFAHETVVKIDPVYSTWNNRPLTLTEREAFGLVTARVQQWKGPVQLCQALSGLADQEAPPIRWIGREMPYNSREKTGAYLTRVFPGTWNKRIIHEPPLSNDQVKILQEKVKFGIVPSTWDMFNFTCLEFLAAGTVVICSDGAGCAGLIDHGKNGFKYAALDPDGLAACLKQAHLLKEADYGAMVLAGTATIREQLSPDLLVPLNLAQYEAVIRNFRPKTSNPFFDAAYQPSEKEYDLGDSLDAIPLKRLLQYISARLKNKIGISNS